MSENAIEWNEDLLATLGEGFAEAVLAAVEEVLLPALRERLSQQGPPPSAPGTPPHRTDDREHLAHAVGLRAGQEHLADSLSAALEGDTVSISSPNLYGYFLEVGTRNTMARPWLHPVMEDPAIRDAFTRAVAEHLARR